MDPRALNAYFDRGYLRAAKGDVDGAIADYSKVIAGDTDASAPVLRRLREGLQKGAYTNRGKAYQAKGDFKRAIEDFTVAIADDAHASRFVNRAEAYEKSGDAGRAIEDYTSAIDRDPTSAEAYYRRGTAYASVGRLELAKADHRKATELDPLIERRSDDW